ncbi:MAG: hypothetical protein DRO09_00100 [Thermoprotei archaeon]|nr:MAG: hypothetical protein DRO09_00100 [Thermoprotei archaeon]
MKFRVRFRPSILATIIFLGSALLMSIYYGQENIAAAIITAIAGLASKLVESEEKTSSEVVE